MDSRPVILIPLPPKPALLSRNRMNPDLFEGITIGTCSYFEPVSWSRMKETVIRSDDSVSLLILGRAGLQRLWIITVAVTLVTFF
jgi:hypothetical protein